MTNGDMLKSEAARILEQHPRIFSKDDQGVARIKAALDTIVSAEDFPAYLTAFCVILAADDTGQLLRMINQRLIDFMFADYAKEAALRASAPASDAIN